MNTVTKTYTVHGMHCASCSSLISKRLKKLPGIADCDVNYATEKATVTYDPMQSSTQHMNNEIQKLGYTIGPSKESDNMMNNHEHTMSMDHSEHLGLNQSKDEKLQELQALREKVEFIVPITLLIFVLMLWDIAAQVFISIPNLPIPMELFTIISFLLATVSLFWIGKPYLDAVVRFVRFRAANMDSLVGIGTLTAYLYSSTIFLAAPLREFLRLPDYTYFDVTIVVIGFITLGKYLEARSKLKTGEAIEKLLNLQAKTALVLRSGKEIEIPLSEVKIDDIVIVKPGTKIPVDGIITDGSSAIDESMITGEPLPNDKTIGDVVIGGTINKQGRFSYRVTKVGPDTMLSQIIRMVEEAQGSKAPIQSVADTISSIFVPAVLVLAIATLTLWLVLGAFIMHYPNALSLGLLSFVSILVIACPCALGLATPTAIIVGVGKAAQYGILIKNAEAMEMLSTVQTIVFDKTGTITRGHPMVTDIVPEKGLSEKKLLHYAASIEKHSDHPLSKAITKKSTDLHLQFEHVESFKETEGIGVEGRIGKQFVRVRKPDSNEHQLPSVKRLESEGKTVIIVEINKKIAGVLAISDTIKEQTKDTIARLKTFGLETILLTGDNQHAAHYIANQVGIDTVHAQALPKDKATFIQSLQKKNKIVAMVGDGINDAPSLTQAHVGIAMATGTDIAIESADITLLRGDISTLPFAIKLSRTTMSTIKQNLFWAFIYNVIGIPLASGLFYPFFGVFLNPIFAGMAMALSSVSVVLNSLRLKQLKMEQ